MEGLEAPKRLENARASSAEGRVHVSYEGVEKIIYRALRHRIIRSFQAQAESVSTDHIIGEVLRQVWRN